MTQMEYWCDIFARTLCYLVILSLPYGIWWNDQDKRQGRAIDAYINGQQRTMYL